MVVCAAMDKTRAPSSPRHAYRCDLILEHLTLSDLGDKQMEWWWSYRLNRRETMSCRVAAADMRAREELLLACLLAGERKRSIFFYSKEKLPAGLFGENCTCLLRCFWCSFLPVMVEERSLSGRMLGP